MKEPKLNEVFDHNGQTFKCVEDTGSGICINCDFYDDCNFKKDHTQLACLSSERSDNLSVIFEEVKP